MIKKCLVLVLLCNIAHAKFADLKPNYPYYDSIIKLQAADVIRGYDDASFRPEAPVNRAEFLKIIVQAFPEKFRPCATSQLTLTDVFPEQWFFEPVCQATQEGVIKGYQDQSFRPGNFLNIAEAAKILSLAADLPDFESDPWYQTYLQNLEAQHALLPSFDTPADLINRGEVAEIIVRISQNIRNKSHSAYDTTAQKFVPQLREEIYPYPQKLSLPALKNQKLIGRQFEVEAKISENSLYTKYNIGYQSNGMYISGIMLVPKKTSEPVPLLVLNHGYYPADFYQQRGRGTGMTREQDYFARQGFLVLHSDYRGYADAEANPEDRHLYDGALGYTMDIYNLIEAFKKYQSASPSTLSHIPKTDRQKIFMLGHSMGGGITQNIITMWPELIDKAVLYASAGGNAWYNYQRWWKQREESNFSETSWRSPTQNPWSWNQLSAKHFYENIQTPLMVFHGVRDAATSFGVPVHWSDEAVARLEELGKNVQYTRYPYAGHTFVGSNWEEFVTKSRDFFLSD